MKKRTKIAAAVTAGITATYFSYKTISKKMFNDVFKAERNTRELSDENKKWFSESNVCKVCIRSFDGLKLYSYKVSNHNDRPYIVLVHGINNSKEAMLSRAVEFDKLGYNLLIVDQRGNGESEGEYVTFGQKESLDLLLWIKYLTVKHPSQDIILYGVSMGAATVMMTAGYVLPENVKCIIEDCGYSSLYEELDFVIKRDYKVSYTKPILAMIENMMVEKFGFGFEDISPKMSLEHNYLPIVFVHGDEDDLVPFDMATVLYNHTGGVKKYYPVSGVGHAKAHETEKYYENLDNFIKSCLN